MNRILPLVTCIVLCVATAAQAADAFEGTVAMKMTPAGGAASTMTYSIKSDLTRIDIDAGGRGGTASQIIDLKKQEITVLIPQQNMFMKQPMPQATAAAQTGKAPAATIEKTSETEKILGYTATKYVSKAATGTTEVWAADELGAFPGLAAAGGRGGMMGRGAPAATPVGQEWVDAVKGKPMFPLRVVSKDAGGKETFRMEATAISRKTLPDSLFAPPADAQDVNAMMRGAMQGIGIPGMPGRGN